MKTVFFPSQGPRSESDQELYKEALRMMQNIEAFAALAGPRVPLQEGEETVVLADQMCTWQGPHSAVELTAHAVVKVDLSEGHVLACHGLQASSEVESFTLRIGNDGARLYDWTAADGARKIHVYSAVQAELPGFLVIVQD
jgi:hypothetical protein